MSSEPTLFVVDNDPATRESLQHLAASVSLPVETFSSGEEFLTRHDRRRPGCLVVDVRMPGMSGLELQARLAAEDPTLPVIFLTAYGDIPTAVRSLKAGAVDFLEKPWQPQALLDRIHEALVRNEQARRADHERARVEARLALLTPREKEIMHLVAAGKTAKQIAVDLGLSHKTVQVHRARILEKMEVETTCELVRRVMDLDGHTPLP